jgi:hypothetical protein
MDNPFCVRGVQRVGHLNRQVEPLIRPDRLGRDALAQRLPFQQLHRQERPSLVFADIVNDANVGMVQGRGSPRFALEPLERCMISGVIIRQKLERDGSAQPRVFGLVHHPHAACPELLENPVMRNGGAGHGAQ